MKTHKLLHIPRLVQKILFLHVPRYCSFRPETVTQASMPQLTEFTSIFKFVLSVYMAIRPPTALRTKR